MKLIKNRINFGKETLIEERGKTVGNMIFADSAMDDFYPQKLILFLEIKKAIIVFVNSLEAVIIKPS